MSEQQQYWNTEEHGLVYRRLLLAEAGRLYEKHKIGQDDSFNIFSVLRKESDEVHLHSRFLHALLEYRDQKSGIRENLKLFLKHIGIKEFELEGEAVERERSNIDILIRNKDTAVAIENKIYSGDRKTQLHRYKQNLENLGYKNIYMVYLTLWGKDPSPESLGDLDNEEIIKISYHNSPKPEKSIRPWLKDCQNRAIDHPELQVAIKQYRSIVQMLTPRESLKGYEKEALELLCQNDNLLVLKNLHKA